MTPRHSRFFPFHLPLFHSEYDRRKLLPFTPYTTQNSLQQSTKMAETTVHDPPSSSEMSETTTHPLSHSSTDKLHQDHGNYSMKDVIMWRKKRVSLGVVTTATVLWVVMEVYGYNFITVASWIGIFLVSSVFTWANIYKLIYKEEPSMSGLGISEKTVTGIANWIRVSGEEAMRWVFKVGAQSEWYVFAAAVAGLWLLSVIGSCSDLLTLLYIGTMVGMSAPVIWMKYDDKIREHGERLQMQSMKFYSTMKKNVQNLMDKVKDKVNSPTKEMKEKKVE
ncbi:unnamed protein product [Lactuca virosa]|uniref:Reticulon-like protein n=1 Tax=Lactuca virosa TaxID=75947 RepID=A0AAU9LYW0_9ASTR|nr:unnamed protein product [Lactuca virosa]